MPPYYLRWSPLSLNFPSRIRTYRLAALRAMSVGGCLDSLSQSEVVNARAWDRHRVVFREGFARSEIRSLAMPPGQYRPGLQAGLERSWRTLLYGVWTDWLAGERRSPCAHQ